MNKLAAPDYLMVFPKYTNYALHKRLIKKFRYQFFLMLIRLKISWLEDYSKSNQSFAELINHRKIYSNFFKAIYQGYVDRHHSAKQRFDLIADDLNLVSVKMPVVLRHSDLCVEIARISDAIKLCFEPNPLNCAEGIWSVNLYFEGERLYTLTFSCNHSTALVIGSIQGSNKRDAKNTIKTITKALHGLRPQQLMIWLAWQFADSLQLPSVEGIASNNHPKMTLSRRLRHKKVFEADYDKIWQDYHGIVLKNGNWQIPRLQQKPLEAIESKKRSMYKKRYEMLSTLTSDLQRNLLITNPIH